MQVEQIMTRSPAVCFPQSTLEDVARLMLQRNCGMIPVVDTAVSMVPVGVITDRDITCRTVGIGMDPLGMAVGDVMSKRPLTVHPFESLDTCVKVMEQNDIRRVLVVDDKGKCIGIVAQADIAKNAPADEVAELVKDISQGQMTAAAALL
jgi:CBS domain-containing protein